MIGSEEEPKPNYDTGSSEENQRSQVKGEEVEVVEEDSDLGIGKIGKIDSLNKQ